MRMVWSFMATRKPEMESAPVPSLRMHAVEPPVEHLRLLTALSRRVNAHMHGHEDAFDRFERDVAAEGVALEHRPQVIAVLPGDDGRDVGQRQADVGGREPDRVAAVDEPATGRRARGIVMCGGDVE